MLKHLNLEKLLFFDIETVSYKAHYNELSLAMQALWQHKHQFVAKPEENFESSYTNKAAIYAEYGKIVCISCGFFVNDEFRIKSFANEDEATLLEEFSALLLDTRFILCGHNIKEFDVPYVCRRLLIKGLSLPRVLDVAGKKPWEVDYIDTLQLWKFGDFKHYTSINLLANIFDIPTPKDDIDGSQVGKVFWEENDLERIVEYCQKDVITVARLVQKWKGDSLLKDEDIHVIA
ncbi:MAG: DNA polymerase elongation subunit (family B) [Chitinophagales bacterium]|jgi:DNA polymerase elongation subunit (family B)